MLACTLKTVAYPNVIPVALVKAIRDCGNGSESQAAEKPTYEKAAIAQCTRFSYFQAMVGNLSDRKTSVDLADFSVRHQNNNCGEQ